MSHYYHPALGYHRSEEAFQYLISRVGYNIEPMRARFQAVDGLAYSTSWQTDRLQKQAKETLGKCPTLGGSLIKASTNQVTL